MPPEQQPINAYLFSVYAIENNCYAIFLYICLCLFYLYPFKLCWQCWIQDIKHI